MVYTRPLLMAALAALTVEASAQSRAYIDGAGTVTIYDGGGRVRSRTHTDSAGTVTVYGAGGRLIGRETTSGTVYDARGRKVGRVTTSRYP